MADELVTISNYTFSVEAHLARNRLLDEGVLAFVIDDVAADIGGPYLNVTAKLQVPASHAELAQAILADEGHGPVDFEWAAVSSALIDEESEPECSARELNAERACRGAVFFFVNFPPVQIYVFWLLLKVLVSKESLRPRYQKQAWLAAAINLPVMFLILPVMFLSLGYGESLLLVFVAQAIILLAMFLYLGMCHFRSRRIVRSTG